ncbi:outer membrane protein [Bartonella phoceensis]|uniref:outer membrane protein n=1 Tax=Bartonella phoceensis TaxID=270249 RepID=UPI001ABAABAA|nr:outer membrane beta-barrel protein [Bartonella phoceensis]
MNTKCLATIFVTTLFINSPVQAADTSIYPVGTRNSSVYPVQAANNISYPASRSNYPSTVVSPPFSWAGIYFGGQIGGFSSTNAFTYSEDIQSGKWVWINKNLHPKFSGFIGGFYGGTNIDIGSDFIIGIDADVVFSGKKNTKTDNGRKIKNSDELASIEATLQQAGIPIIRPGAPDETIPNIGHTVVNSITLKEKWGGAIRVRLGLTSHYVMPYISIGVAYAQMQYTASLLAESREESFIFASGNVFDKATMMVGYTFGGGIDFAVTENIVLRAEYRYSDFGQKTFEQDKLQVDYKTNDFRFGFAYKF